MRPLLYVHAHKCLRNAIAKLSLRAGATAYDDDAAVLGLVSEIHDVEKILYSHAKNEERNIHPLLKKIQAPAHELEASHQTVDDKIRGFCELADKVAVANASERSTLGNTLYRTLVEFDAFYLGHMRDEEERFLPMIMEAFGDADIQTTREQIHAGISHEEMILFVRYQLPALSPSERVDAMAKYKKRFDAGQFADLCAEAESVLAPEAWHAVKKAVLGDGVAANPARIEDVLTYWFGENPDEPAIIDKRAPFWFAGPQNRLAIDIAVRAKFGGDYERACRGELASWNETPRGRLALIILLDQFSRNLYRDDPRAFAHDVRCQHILLDGMKRGDDKKLRCIERMFFYMPLMHSESLELQNMALECYAQLIKDASETQRAGFERVFGKAKEHHHCIERFGRYPHRNAIFGRPGTPEEQAFLANEPQPGRGNPGAPPAEMIAGKRSS